jgi:hypothetical protein
MKIQVEIPSSEMHKEFLSFSTEINSLNDQISAHIKKDIKTIYSPIEYTFEKLILTVEGPEKVLVNLNIESILKEIFQRYNFNIEDFKIQDEENTQPKDDSQEYVWRKLMDNKDKTKPPTSVGPDWEIWDAFGSLVNLKS